LVQGISHAVIWTAHRTSLAISYVSPSALKILGYGEDAWFEPNFFDHHLHPEDREWALRILRSLEQDAAPVIFEHRFIRADGSEAWLQTSAQLVENASGGTEIQGLMVDLTKQKSAEGALRLDARASAELSTTLDETAALNRLGRVLVPEFADWCFFEMDEVSEPNPSSPRLRVFGTAGDGCNEGMAAWCRLVPAQSVRTLTGVDAIVRCMLVDAEHLRPDRRARACSRRGAGHVGAREAGQAQAFRRRRGGLGRRRRPQAGPCH
jgi:PAS domain S-box-containing protein